MRERGRGRQNERDFKRVRERERGSWPKNVESKLNGVKRWDPDISVQTLVKVFVEVVLCSKSKKKIAPFRTMASGFTRRREKSPLKLFTFSFFLL